MSLYQILLYAIPIFSAIVTFLVKRKSVRYRDGKEYAKKELAIDVVRVVITYLIIIAITLFAVKESYNFVVLLPDSVALFLFSITLASNQYDYQSRKLLPAIIIMGCVFPLFILIALSKLMMGTFNPTDTVTSLIVLKFAIYALTLMWAGVTMDVSDAGIFTKGRYVLSQLKSAWISREYKFIDYAMYLCLGIVMFVNAYNGILTPISFVGFHDIYRRKYIRGVLLLILSNCAIYLKTGFGVYADLIHFVVVTWALVELIIAIIIVAKKSDKK